MQCCIASLLNHSLYAGGCFQQSPKVSVARIRHVCRFQAQIQARQRLKQILLTKSVKLHLSHLVSCLSQDSQEPQCSLAVALWADPSSPKHKDKGSFQVLDTSFQYVARYGRRILEIMADTFSDFCRWHQVCISPCSIQIVDLVSFQPTFASKCPSNCRLSNASRSANV